MNIWETQCIALLIFIHILYGDKLKNKTKRLVSKLCKLGTNHTRVYTDKVYTRKKIFLIFLFTFEALKKYQDGIRFQIQNTILKELDEIYKLDVTASFLNL